MDIDQLSINKTLASLKFSGTIPVEKEVLNKISRGLAMKFCSSIAF